MSPPAAVPLGVEVLGVMSVGSVGGGSVSDGYPGENGSSSSSMLVLRVMGAGVPLLVGGKSPTIEGGLCRETLGSLAVSGWSLCFICVMVSVGSLEGLTYLVCGG